MAGYFPNECEISELKTIALDTCALPALVDLDEPGLRQVLRRYSFRIAFATGRELAASLQNAEDEIRMQVEREMEGVETYCHVFASTWVVIAEELLQNQYSDYQPSVCGKLEFERDPQKIE